MIFNIILGGKSLILATFFLSFIRKIFNMEKSIAVIVTSKRKTDENKPLLDHIKATSGCEVHIFSIYNSEGVSLSKIYSDMLSNEDVMDNIVVFMHDDIEFLRDGWGSEVIRLFEENKEYGIIGVAGSSQFDADAAWWRYEKKYGQVLHRNEGKSWLTAFSPLLDKDLQEVVVVDGLFIAVNKERISVNFNDELEAFDFYDVDFCLSNHFANACKIGVTTNIRVAHNSVGNMRDSWYKNREIINQKFGKYYPIDIEKKKKKGIKSLFK